jgi:peptidyl-prolyl cis-trans isomerase C
MRKSWLLCVLAGAMAWGQAQPVQTPPSPGSAPKPAGSPSTPPTADIPESAVVITIHGVCPAAPKTATAAKTASAKTAAAKKPTDCKTEITRAQFDKLASALQQGPNPLTPQQKRMLANQLPGLIAMSEAAKEKGLEKSPKFAETMKFLKMRVLSAELQQSVQEQAENVPQHEIEDYYKKNPEAYQQFSLDRLFVPRYKQEPAEKNAGEKLTPEEQKAKQAADKAKQEQGEQEMTKLADTLRTRAAAGEDFIKLQKEAFEAAGMKNDSPTVNLPKVRRTGLPPAHVAVFDLKAGEVSQVITDNGGHYIYKVVTEETVPLDQVKEEIRNTLKGQRVKEMMDKYTTSYHADTNDAYFGPPAPSGPMGARSMPNRMPRPNMPPGAQSQPQGAPPAATPSSQPPAQSPAQPAPPSQQH